MNFGEYSYRLLRNVIKDKVKYFKEIEDPLKKSHLPYSLEEYVAMMILISGLVFLMFSIVMSILFYSLIGILGIAVALLVSVVIAGIAFFVLYLWPKQNASAIKKNIENSLYYVAIYMAAMASIGLPPYRIFETIAKFKDFKEIARICQRIVDDIHILNLETVEAIEVEAAKIPSDEFRELLVGMRSTITTGGDLGKYITEKANAALENYKNRIKSFTDSLSVYLEIYITVVIVGTIFALVMSSIMGIFGMGGVWVTQLQTFLIFVGLPVLTAAFVVLIKAASPTGG